MPPVRILALNFLFASGLQQRLRFGRRTGGAMRNRARDKAAAEHARLPRWRIIEHAGLAGRNALLAANQFDLVAATYRAQPCRLRRAGGTHAHENLKAVANGLTQRTVADPVD